jgi:hypothetical protein
LPATADVKLFDAEAVVNEPAVQGEPVTDLDADTQGLASTGQTEHP